MPMRYWAATSPAAASGFRRSISAAWSIAPTGIATSSTTKTSQHLSKRIALRYGRTLPTPQTADNPRRKEIHAEDESDAQPQQPTVADQRLEVVLRQHQQHGADHRAVHRAHAADHHHQQDVDHDVEGKRSVGVGLARP